MIVAEIVKYLAVKRWVNITKKQFLFAISIFIFSLLASVGINVYTEDGYHWLLLCSLTMGVGSLVSYLFSFIAFPEALWVENAANYRGKSVRWASLSLLFAALIFAAGALASHRIQTSRDAQPAVSDRSRDTEVDLGFQELSGDMIGRGMPESDVDPKKGSNDSGLDWSAASFERAVERQQWDVVRRYLLAHSAVTPRTVTSVYLSNSAELRAMMIFYGLRVESDNCRDVFFELSSIDVLRADNSRRNFIKHFCSSEKNQSLIAERIQSELDNQALGYMNWTSPKAERTAGWSCLGETVVLMSILNKREKINLAQIIDKESAGGGKQDYLLRSCSRVQSETQNEIITVNAELTKWRVLGTWIK